MRPFVDRVVDHSTLQDLAQHHADLDVAAIETCLVFLRATADVHTALDAHFARYGSSMGKVHTADATLPGGWADPF